MIKKINELFEKDLISEIQIFGTERRFKGNKIITGYIEYCENFCKYITTELQNDKTFLEKL